jgi:translation initiation factor 2 beta subunit (eIF-2beta)/eIF-5
MTAGKLKVLIQQGERISRVFKESRRALNRDVYETVCSFLKRTAINHTNKLQDSCLLQRIGTAKGGHWEML